MQKLRKVFPLTLASFLLPSLLSSCAVDNTFYMANYESYINNELLATLESGNSFSEVDNNKVEIHNFAYRTYTTNEDLERNFSTNYDVAVPSVYLAAKYANQGKLLLIDWSKFGLYELDKNGNRVKDSNGNDILITQAYQALSLFTPLAREEILSYDVSEALSRDGITKDNPNYEAGLLNYCVPYFIQDVVFGYNSENEWWNELGTTWNEIMSTLYQKIADSEVKRVTTVDDYSTLYAIARLLQTDSETVNPGDPFSKGEQSTPYEGDLSINEAIQTFKTMFNSNVKHNTFLFNTDSNIVLNDFAQNASQAIISYNGDLLYAMQGGDNYAASTNKVAFKNWWLSNATNNVFNLRFVRPKNNFSVMDCMVINKSRVTAKNHTDEAYAVIKKIALEGSDLSLYTSDSKDQYSSENIFEQDKNNSYIYGPMINFDYTNYTSPLLTLNAYVMNSDFNTKIYQNDDNNGLESIDTNLDLDLGGVYDSLSNNLAGIGYFTKLYNWIDEKNESGFLDDQSYQRYIYLLTVVYNVSGTVTPNLLTRSFSDLVKDNISWAWTTVKSEL